MTPAHTRLLFRSAALFNVLAGVPILFASHWFAALVGITSQPSSVFMQIAGLAIVGFGWGYWQVAQAPRQNRSIVKLGMVLKIGVVAIAAGNWLAGTINALLPVIASGDLVYAWLFWLHLRASATTIKAEIT